MPPPAPVILVAIQLINLIVSKVQAPTSAVAMVQLAMANINVAPVLRLILGAQMPVLAPPLINMPAPAQVTPEVPAPLAMVSIPNVLANLLILGHQEPANAPQLINTPAPALATPAAPAPPAAENINPVHAQAAITGMVAAVMPIRVLTKAMGHIAKYTVAMGRWLVSVPLGWTSM